MQTYVSMQHMLTKMAAHDGRSGYICLTNIRVSSMILPQNNVLNMCQTSVYTKYIPYR